jgi:hypothetical protein
MRLHDGDTSEELKSLLEELSTSADLDIGRSAKRILKDAFNVHGANW